MAKKRQKSSGGFKEFTLKQFFIGIILFVVIQAAFMVGGLFIEQAKGMLITGIPSAIGMTLLLGLGMILNQKKPYAFLGLFSIAFLSPLILFLISFFAPDRVDSSFVSYTLLYLIVVILAVWTYFTVRILRNKL